MTVAGAEPLWAVLRWRWFYSREGPWALAVVSTVRAQGTLERMVATC